MIDLLLAIEPGMAKHHTDQHDCARVDSMLAFCNFEILFVDQVACRNSFEICRLVIYLSSLADLDEFVVDQVA
jgi:hypothetical protein